MQRRVLLIEDDSWIRTFMRDVLLEEGYAVLEAADGLTGLRMARSEKPDAVLLDVAMPELTGKDVLRALKRDRSTRRIPVVVTSAFPGALAPGEVELLEAVLAKPLQVNDLLEQLQRLLGNHSACGAV